MVEDREVLERIARALEKIADNMQKLVEAQVSEEAVEELEEIDDAEETDERLIALEKLSVEGISKEMIMLAKERDNDISMIDYLLLEKHGITDNFGLPFGLRRKLSDAQNLAEDFFIGQEKQELPVLIDECVQWACTNNLKKVSKSDVNTFLFDKNKKLYTTTKDALYTKTNLKLKTLK